MRSRLLAVATVLVVVASVGCIGDASEDPSQQVDPQANPSATGGNNTTGPSVVLQPPGGGNATNATAPGPTPLRFDAPVHLNEDGLGFEPSIEAGPNGTIYVTAARSVSPEPPGERASWIWYSTDGGDSWQLVPSPGRVHARQEGLEGSIATDGEGRLYFVDTYLVDNTLSRWSPQNGEPSWDFSRPVQGTTAVDDRPWLAAHGDGVVYYAGNNGVFVPPATPGPGAGPDGGRYWVYASTDGGVTFSPGTPLPQSGWCQIAADPTDDATVYAACERFEDSDSTHLTVFASTDQGQSFTPHKVDEFERALTDGYPSPAVDRAGTPYAVWPDGDYDEDSTTHVRYAYRTDDGNWSVLDITPFEGSFDEVWAAGGDEGTLGAVFYGTRDTQPDSGSVWHVYAASSADADSPDPTWTVTRITDEPVAERAGSPDDFFQVDIGPDNRMHVVYEREGSQEVLYQGQVSGPGLGGG